MSPSISDRPQTASCILKIGTPAAARAQLNSIVALLSLTKAVGK